MTAPVSFRIAAIVMVFAALAPIPAAAQLGEAVSGMGDAVKKKMDDNNKAVVATGQGASKAPAKQNGTPGPAKVSPGKNKTPGLPESLTKQEVVLEIGLDVLNSFSAALAAEAADRGAPAKRDRCVANVAAGHEMTTLMNSRAAELEKLAKSAAPEDQKVLAAIASELATRKADLEVSRCGAVVEVRTTEEYAAIGALGGGFTPEQYASLKERVAPFCEANEAGAVVVDNPKITYSESEKIAMKSRCRTLLPNLMKVIQRAPAQTVQG